MRKILSRTRAAVDDYKMIQDGDKIAVGVSGGKDSVMLLKALCDLKRFYPANFEIVAITLDMRFDNQDGDFSPIQKLCDEYNIEYVIQKTDLYEIIFNIRKEECPCSLCARMRRGILHDTAKQLGCNKIALGHHLDDAVETFMMSLMHEGRIGCFSPVTVYDDTGISVIRPMIYTKERDIKSFIKANSIQIIKSPCPENHNTEREKMKDFLHPFEVENRGMYERVLGSLERREIDGWF